MSFLSTSGPGQASGPNRAPAVRRPNLTEDWGARLRAADQALRKGSWSEGADLANSVLSEMRDRITGGEGSANAFAAGLVLRAIGEAGTGKLHQAAWSFAAAEYFNPAYATFDLTPFGTAGEALSRAQQEAIAETPPVPGWPPLPINATSPRRIEAPKPVFPRGKSLDCSESKVILIVILGKDGVPRSPRVVGAADPVLTFAAFESMVHWRFEPATMLGRPVSVYYALTINFLNPRCGKK